MEIRKLAAIDIGSNAIRLLINYVYEGGNTPPIFNKTSLVRMPIRLGRDVFTNNRISDVNIDRLCDTMEAYRLMMKIYDIEHFKAFATSAMREAENAQEIIDKIQEKSGIHIEVIDGKTEGELIFSTELKSFVEDKKNYLYVDVGGGSTEFTLLKHNHIAATYSFPVGTVRLMEGKVPANAFPEMEKWIKENIKSTDRPIELIGSGGNINHVYKSSGIPNGKPLKCSYLAKQYKNLLSMDSEERMRTYNMKPDRADVVVYALKIYSNVAKWSHATEIHVPKIGLSDGIIHSIYKELLKNK